MVVLLLRELKLFKPRQLFIEGATDKGRTIDCLPSIVEDAGLEYDLP